jgi:predicted chitinase
MSEVYYTIVDVDGCTDCQPRLNAIKDTCYCNRDFTVAEMTNIIEKLRKNDDVHDEQQYHNKIDPIYIENGIKLIKKGSSGFYTLDNKFFKKENPEKNKNPIRYMLKKSKFDELGLNLFNKNKLEATVTNNEFTYEKDKKTDPFEVFNIAFSNLPLNTIKTESVTIEALTKQINETFTKYKINTCVRKIHFLAQSYVETARFTKTYEGLKTAPDNYLGGVSFQGRGLMHLTHDVNYLRYYSDENGSKEYDNFMKYKDKRDKSFIAYMKKENSGVNPVFEKKLRAFAAEITTDLYHACNSAGWFWNLNKINLLADQDNVAVVTKIINGGDNGLTERATYTKDLKTIFGYEKCKNKK